MQHRGCLRMLCSGVAYMPQRGCASGHAQPGWQVTMEPLVTSSVTLWVLPSASVAPALQCPGGRQRDRAGAQGWQGALSDVSSFPATPGIPAGPRQFPEVT